MVPHLLHHYNVKKMERLRMVKIKADIKNKILTIALPRLTERKWNSVNLIPRLKKIYHWFPVSFEKYALMLSFGRCKHAC